MEINLLLTAKRLELAEQLTPSETSGGVRVIKNVPECTYLAVTPKQWKLLIMFRQAQTVPRLLETIIEERHCPPLGEFYELILKAVRANILIDSDYRAKVVPAVNWPVLLKPQRMRYALWALLAVGLGFSAALHPVLPTTLVAGAASLGAALLAYVLGTALAASLLHGAGGEVYMSKLHWISLVDVCMLTPTDQRVVLLAPAGLLATATGLLTWQRPEWSFFPLLGLILQLRPVLHGGISRMIRAGSDPRLSDAEHAFLFPLNRTPRKRWKLLWSSLRNSTTWKEIGYGIIWTIALGYFVGVLTEVPPWTMIFWKTRGPWLGLSLVASLILLGSAYLGSELFLFAHQRSLARRETTRMFYRRWFKRGSQSTEIEARSRAILRSPLLRQLSPPDQNAMASAMQPFSAGPWKILHTPDEPLTHMSLILSGRVGVYRRHRSGRRALVQVLSEDDLVGLHAAADPSNPEFLYRTLTPVLMLRLEWAQAEQLIVAQMPKPVLTNLVQKLPFLARISLCQNWHMQAVQRFAELSVIKDYRDNEVMLQEGVFSDSFFILMESEARILRRGKLKYRMHSGNFFGEIGLLQNSRSTAQVVAGEGARSLCIQRADFLRFVAHNYSVAIELERVSSQRLGRPIFPLAPDNFKTTI